MTQPEAILGQVLDGRFRVEEIVTAAVDLTVYRATDLRAMTTAIVRVPRSPGGTTRSEMDAMLTQFIAEAKRLEQLGRATNDIERLLGWGTAAHQGERIPYCAFEPMLGRSLAEDRSPKGMPIGRAIAILGPIARALAAAHDLGITHGDVRPENMVSPAQGTSLKLAGWSLASRLGEGTPSFAAEYGAPEHFKRSFGPIGNPTDVYALGLVLIEMVTGKPALEGNDYAELLRSTSDVMNRPGLRARGARASEQLENVIGRAIAIDPRLRWPTARAFWEALVDAARPEPPSMRDLVGDGPPSSQPSYTSNPSLPSLPSQPSLPSLPSHPSHPSQASHPSLSSYGSHPAQMVMPPIQRLDSPTQSKKKSGLSAMRLAFIATLGFGLLAAGVGIRYAGKSATRTVVPATPTKVAPPPLSTPPTAAPPPMTSEPVSLAPPDMVRVAAGTFVMGNDKEGAGDRPAHRVTITHPFFIDKTEVTAEAYQACVTDGACTPRNNHVKRNVTSSYACNTDRGMGSHPANCVDYEQAKKYCAHVKKRLPTEAEWEYAARGSDERMYPWGNTPPEDCNHGTISAMPGPCGQRKGTTPVGTYPDGASAFGALDMAGNVWEWTDDRYAPYTADDAADPHVKIEVKPDGPTGRATIRGGSWDYSAVSAKATFRLPFPVDIANSSVGFRCARSEK